MYPRNAVSPERIAIGAIVQISDGAVQTSGVSIKVMPQGGAAGAGGGTTGYEEGIVHYIPTQAETNYASFVVIAYKTGCIPVAQTIVTSKSATTGYAGIDWGQVLNASTTVNLSSTTVKTATDVETDTADIQSRLPAALVSGRIDASVGAMASAVLTATAIASDAITAAKVASDVTTELQSGLATASALSAVAGYLDTEIAEILADTNELQTDWANGGRLDLLIDAIKAKTDNLPAAPAATGDIPTAGAVADAVWDEILSGHAISGSTGEALSAAGGAGDPWITALPGSYSAGQAGYILGTNLDAAISTRSTYAGADTAGTTTLLSRLTSTRAGYLDNLSGGAVALASSILDAAGIRSALGLASANLDTQLDALPTANENADALLGRNVAGGSSTGRLVKEALYFLRNKWTISGGTLTVFATDDTTSSWTASVTQTAGDPVSASDPS